MFDTYRIGGNRKCHTIDERRLKQLHTEFSIAICRPTGDNWQSKTLFLAIFDPRFSIVNTVSAVYFYELLKFHAQILIRFCRLQLCSAKF